MIIDESDLDDISIYKSSSKALRPKSYYLGSASFLCQKEEAFQALETVMDECLRGNAKPSFYLASFDPGAGKTTAILDFLKG